MDLSIVDLGIITVYPEATWSIENGPKGTRSATTFREVVWEGERVNARSLWANGTYLLGASGIAEPEIRILFDCGDGAQLFVHYLARFDAGKLFAREVPGPMMAGTVETGDERYAWLNETMLVGNGRFDFVDAVSPSKSQMVYEVGALTRS